MCFFALSIFFREAQPILSIVKRSIKMLSWKDFIWVGRITKYIFTILFNIFIFFMKPKKLGGQFSIYDN